MNRNSFTSFAMTAIVAITLVAAGSARAGTIDSDSFNGVSSGVITTAGLADWGYVSVAGGFFDSNLGGAGLSYGASEKPTVLVDIVRELAWRRGWR